MPFRSCRPRLLLNATRFYVARVYYKFRGPEKKEEGGLEGRLRSGDRLSLRRGDAEFLRRDVYRRYRRRRPRRDDARRWCTGNDDDDDDGDDDNERERERFSPVYNNKCR